ncbi:MAG: hypothetical protein HC803_01630 [Saprospiraceae bacterium]|nr:hypothetical protein [Saprospiraceae bacterium]
MKKNLVLLSCILIIMSCNKDTSVENNPVQEQVQKKFLTFSKSLSLEDREGNSVDLTVYANTQEALDDHTADVLHLIANKKKHNITSSISLSKMETETDSDEEQDNFVYIKVEKYNFNDDVTGFKIQSDIEYFGQQSNYRYSDSYYFYQYGANDVNGAKVTYTGETQSKEYLSIKFEKKTASSNWFWQSIATGNLYNVNDIWDHCGSNYWAEFKLKVTVHDAKAGICCYGFDWEFLINC